MIIDKIERINYTRSSGRQWPGLDRAVLQKIQLLDTHVHTFESLKYHKSDKKATDKSCHGNTEKQTETARERVV